jgi:hypothetical protein
MMKYFLFYDLHSGGYPKEDDKELIVIRACCYDNAISKFIEKFGHDPRDIACECCGENYSISEYDSLEEIGRNYRGDIINRKGELFVVEE